MKVRCNKANELKQQWNEGNYIPKFETQKGLKHNKRKIQKKFGCISYFCVYKWVKLIDAIKPMNLDNKGMKEIIFQRWKHRKDRSMKNVKNTKKKKNLPMEWSMERKRKENIIIASRESITIHCQPNFLCDVFGFSLHIFMTKLVITC